VGLKADIFVDAGAQLSKVSLQKSATLAGLSRDVFVTNSNAATRAVIGGNSSDLNGALLYPDGQPRFSTIYVNGGSAGHANVMGAAGRQALADFYSAGGSYTGSCAGEFIAANHIKSIYGGQVGNYKRTGRQTVTFTETDHPIVQYLQEWNGGSNVVAGIPHYYGPTNRSTYRHPEGTDFIGTVTSGLHKGSDFLIEYQRDSESGVAVLSPSHPEYNRNSGNTALMAAILKRADDLSQTTPDLKGTLTSGQTVVMSSPTQKVGDGQYHRYQVEVPAGLSALHIRLGDLTGNADLFIQKDGVAHQDSYLAQATATGTSDDTITLQNPEAGIYEISVFGAHTLLNGVAYTLSVEAPAAGMQAALVAAVFAEGEPTPDPSAVWPKGVGVRADIFVDGGDYVSKKSLEAPANLAGLTREVYFSHSAATTRRLIGGNAEDLNGVLLFPDGQPRFSTIFVNGKNSPRHSRALGETGRQAIADFYSAGGSYTGSCGGEFMAAYYIPSIWGGEVYRHGNTGQQTVTFTETDHPIVQYLQEWNGGSNVVAGIPYYWGPVNRSTYRHPEGTEFIGTVTGGLYRGADFLVEYRRDDKSGVAVLSPAHPEYGRRDSHVALMASILKRANDLSRAEPDIKGVLTTDQSVVMSDPAQKVGDGQYHRYKVEVSEGLAALSISLSNLSGNADLFVQRDGVAYAGSYTTKSTAAGVADDMVVIQNPAPGTYEVSVYGAHTILNGAAYTLSLSAERVTTWVDVDDLAAKRAVVADAAVMQAEVVDAVFADAGTIASPWRTRMNELEQRVAKLEQERDEARELLKARMLTALDVEVVESGGPFFVL
jgi:glutamine amidotransferase-like uncharacterized protein